MRKRPTYLKTVLSRVLASQLHNSQRRFAQVHDVRVVQRQQQKCVDDRYEEQLANKARREGFRTIRELKETYQKRQSETAQAAAQSSASNISTSSSEQRNGNTLGEADHRSSSQASNDEKKDQSNDQSNTGTYPRMKSLSSFANVDRLKALSTTQIEKDWHSYHSSNAQALSACMSSETYRSLSDAGRKYPRFVLPVPRKSQGAELHFLEWAFPSSTCSTILFTRLAEFKLRGEYAQSHTIITHHLDIMDSNGLVLLEGNVVPDKGVSIDDSRWLLMCLQKFYRNSEDGSPRARLLEEFGSGSDRFSVDRLLEEAEKVI